MWPLPSQPTVGQRLPLLASTSVYGILFLFLGRSASSSAASTAGLNLSLLRGGGEELRTSTSEPLLSSPLASSLHELWLSLSCGCLLLREPNLPLRRRRGLLGRTLTVSLEPGALWGGRSLGQQHPHLTTTLTFPTPRSLLLAAAMGQPDTA